MNSPLQDFKSSQYERPNQDWVDVAIESPAQDFEAITVRKRSLRNKRNVFTVSLTMFTIGALLIVFNSPLRNDILKPGDLTSSHAQILAKHGTDRCAACHEAATKSFSTWVSDTISGGAKISKCQSDLCMECHKDSISPEFALHPHNVDPADLARKTIEIKQVSSSAKSVFRLPGFRAPVSPNNELACSSCHREHHGKADLTALTNQQCQSCHQDNYHSFEHGHPEFTSWPVQRRQRIAFDHSSHSLKHFPGQNASFDCKSCHVDDGFKNVKLLVDYEQACAKCHDQEVRQSSERGLALFALPMLDLEAIEEADQYIGTWPEMAAGDFDGPIPPIMRLLLCADLPTAELLAKLGNDFDFADIDPTDSEQVRQACALVWQIKFLFHDLSVEGVLAVKKRLESSLGRTVSEKELAGLAADLNEPVFQEAVRRWLPGLNVEVMQKRFGTVTKISWVPNDVLHNFAPDVDGELAPNPLVGLIKPSNSITSPVEPASQPPKQSQASTTPSTGQNGLPKFNTDFGNSANSPSFGNNSNVVGSNVAGNANSTSNNRPTSVPSQQFQTSNSAVNPADLLVENPLKNRIQGQGGTAFVERAAPTQPVQPQPTVSQRPDQPLVVTRPETPSIPTPNGNTPDVNKAIQAIQQIPVATGSVPVVAKSGWFRDDQVFQVTYKPLGHADRCLQAWTDLVASVRYADVRTETASLFKAMTSPSAAGMCRTCHSVDQLSDNSFQMNWEPAYRDVTRRSFTRFSHGPHLIQPQLRDCSHCHEMEKQNADSFASFNPSDAVSNFKPIVKDNCTSCHQEGRTNSGCTMCHSYHVGSHVTGTQN